MSKTNIMRSLYVSMKSISRLKQASETMSLYPVQSNMVEEPTPKSSKKIEQVFNDYVRTGSVIQPSNEHLIDLTLEEIFQQGKDHDSLPDEKTLAKEHLTMQYRFIALLLENGIRSFPE